LSNNIQTLSIRIARCIESSTMDVRFRIDLLKNRFFYKKINQSLNRFSRLRF